MLTNPSGLVGDGGSISPDVLKQIVKELQGLKCAVVAGAAAGTKMNVAALRKEDTIIAVHGVLDAAGSANTPADDTANVTISETRATGTLTISGNPVAAETFVVNGVTYTFRAAGTLTTSRDILITPGDNTAMAAAVAAAVNAYENRRLDTGNNNTPAVVATSALGVVTFTAVADGTAGNALTLTESATNVAVSGAGTLTNGTATGGFTSTTNNTGKTMTVWFFDKQ